MPLFPHRLVSWDQNVLCVSYLFTDSLFLILQILVNSVTISTQQKSYIRYSRMVSCACTYFVGVMWAFHKRKSKHMCREFGGVIIHEQRVTLLCNSPYSEIKISAKHFICFGIITNCHSQIFRFDIVISFGLFPVGKIYLNCVPVHSNVPRERYLEYGTSTGVEI